LQVIETRREAAIRVRDGRKKKEEKLLPMEMPQTDETMSKL